jgi:hypothetical protein
VSSRQVELSPHSDLRVNLMFVIREENIVVLNIAFIA